MSKYLIKGAGIFGSYSHNFKKPSICPYCHISTDAPISAKNEHSFNGHQLFIATCKCTACRKNFFFACEYDSGKTDYDPIIYPAVEFVPYSNDTLKAISPRFIDIYNQALQSEFHNNLELAAIGYRSALEILVKDYAINELKKDPEEVRSKKLYDAIEIYLNQDGLFKTADVVRILGNDHTHYDRKYPQYDFGLLKCYMDIFLKNIEALYLINHPPVSRTL